MTFLDDLKTALKDGWEFVYYATNRYPLTFQNRSGADDMGTGSVGGEIAEFKDSDGNRIGRIDNDGFVFDRAFVGAPGEIKFGAWSSAHVTSVWEPKNWLPCDGRSLVRADYAALFAALGTAYGSVDASHFNIPDLRDSVPAMEGAATFTTRVRAGTNGTTNVAHDHTSPAHTHSGAAHTHTGAAHDHTGAAHTHTGPAHTHTVSGLPTGDSDLNLAHSGAETVSRRSHDHTIDSGGSAAGGSTTPGTGGSTTPGAGGSTTPGAGGSTAPANTGSALTTVSPIQQTVPVYAIIHV